MRDLIHSQSTREGLDMKKTSRGRQGSFHTENFRCPSSARIDRSEMIECPLARAEYSGSGEEVEDEEEEANRSTGLRQSTSAGATDLDDDNEDAGYRGDDKELVAAADSRALRRQLKPYRCSKAAEAAARYRTEVPARPSLLGSLARRLMDGLTRSFGVAVKRRLRRLASEKHRIVESGDTSGNSGNSDASESDEFA